MEPTIDGVIYSWEKPKKATARFTCLSDSLISAREIQDVETYLHPQIEDDPFYSFIKEKAKSFFSLPKDEMFISSDYDVDGTTSAVILGRAFRALGWKVRFFIPDRFVDSYGVNYNRLTSAYDEKPYTLLITSDCGATELTGLSAFAKNNHVAVAVVDHHKRAGEGRNILEINPHLLGDKVRESGYSAAIISAMLVRAGSEFYPELTPLLEGVDILAGLSAFADSASMLQPAARNYAQKFLSGATTESAGVGIHALLKAGNVSGRLTSTDVNFKITPLINAAGRLQNASIIVALFQETDQSIAFDIAQKLKVLNQRRRHLQEVVQHEAFSEYNRDDKVLIACNTSWHAGVVGPAAGQLAELLGIPVFLGGYIPELDSFSFSGRSGSGADIHALVTASVGDLPIRFGGHKVAMGIKIANADIGILPQFKAELERNALPYIKPSAKISKVLRPSSINITNWQDMLRMEPFGVDNPTPVFCLPNVTMTMKPLGSLVNSSKGIITTEDGQCLSALVFRNHKLSDIRNFNGHVVGEMTSTTYKDMNEIQFIIKDLIFS